MFRIGRRAALPAANAGSLLLLSPAVRHARPTAGPLRVHPTNPRYFSDQSGRAVYLTGSHAWNALVDHSNKPVFDFQTYLDFLHHYHHNFVRLWTWEHARVPSAQGAHISFAPLPFVRTGPGVALDGEPKFDLTGFDATYFDRLRNRVSAARARGIYVSVMLFEGWSIYGFDREAGRGAPSSAWEGHPFHPHNNINGIDGDPDRQGNGAALHTLRVPAVTALQEAYLRKVIDTLNDLDNVLYEIANESHHTSFAWQYHLINVIKRYQATKPNQHPVGMTAEWVAGATPGSNDYLFAGPADWISPRHTRAEPYQDNPPPADGRKVIVTDSDHLWGIGGDRAWVWKSFLRGLHPIYMDPFTNPGFPSADELARLNMGYTLAYANRLDLATLLPHNDLASSGYCLASPTAQQATYLVYLPRGGKVQVLLAPHKRVLNIEWLNPATGLVVAGGQVHGGGKRSFTTPWRGDAVLLVAS